MKQDSSDPTHIQVFDCGSGAVQGFAVALRLGATKRDF